MLASPTFGIQLGFPSCPDGLCLAEAELRPFPVYGTTTPGACRRAPPKTKKEPLQRAMLHPLLCGESNAPVQKPALIDMDHRIPVASSLGYNPLRMCSDCRGLVFFRLTVLQSPNTWRWGALHDLSWHPPISIGSDELVAKRRRTPPSCTRPSCGCCWWGDLE